MKIVTNQQNLIIGSGIEIIRESYQGETNLIKVILNNDEYGFYYIGTEDRDLYKIIEISSIPDDFKNNKYFYNNRSFILNENYTD
jgi:hypothetical protein